MSTHHEWQEQHQLLHNVDDDAYLKMGVGIPRRIVRRSYAPAGSEGVVTVMAKVVNSRQQAVPALIHGGQFLLQRTNVGLRSFIN